MDNIIIDIPENRKICINGESFDIILSDFEVLELSEQLSAELSAISGQDAKKVMSALKRTLSVLDRILGEGATQRLLKGRAVSVAFMLDSVITPVVSAVLAGAGEEYNRKISDRYGDACADSAAIV